MEKESLDSERRYSVLEIEEKHLSDIAELERLCFAHPWTESGLRAFLTDSYLGFTAVDNESGRCVAYAGMTCASDEGNITNIAVHPDFRRIGLASSVIARLLASARSAGIKNVFLEVRESNSGARALYEGLGFAVCGRRKNFYRTPTEDALIMAKTL